MKKFLQILGALALVIAAGYALMVGYVAYLMATVPF